MENSNIRMSMRGTADGTDQDALLKEVSALQVFFNSLRALHL